MAEVILAASISHHFLLRIRPLCSGTLERIFRKILLQSDPGALRTSKNALFMLLERLGRTEIDCLLATMQLLCCDTRGLSHLTKLEGRRRPTRILVAAYEKISSRLTEDINICKRG